MKTRETDPTDIFAIRPFLRAFSYRDFFTFSLALLVVALQALVKFYSPEAWLESAWRSINIIIFLLIVPVNHVLYRMEHKRSNNYMGRVIHDFIFIAAYSAVNKLYTYLLTNRFNVDLGEDIFEVILVILLFILLVMMFEGVIALLKRLLNLFAWQVL